MKHRQMRKYEVWKRGQVTWRQTETLADGSNRVPGAQNTQNGGVAIFEVLMAEDFSELKEGVLIYVVHTTCEREREK